MSWPYAVAWPRYGYVAVAGCAVCRV